MQMLFSCVAPAALIFGCHAHSASCCIAVWGPAVEGGGLVCGTAGTWPEDTEIHSKAG